MKGRNTTVVSIRVSDDVYFKMKDTAEGHGLGVSEYFRKFIQTWFSYKNARVIELRISDKAYEELRIQVEELGKGLSIVEFLERFINAWYSEKMWDNYIFKSPLGIKMSYQPPSPKGSDEVR